VDLTPNKQHRSPITSTRESARWPRSLGENVTLDLSRILSEFLGDESCVIECDVLSVTISPIVIVRAVKAALEYFYPRLVPADL